MSDSLKHEKEDVDFLKFILAANDDECKLWPKFNVDYAKRICIKNFNKIPSVDDAVNTLGIELSRSIYAAIKQRRDFINELIGHSAPCHYCGSTNDLFGFDFALMKVQENKRSWGGTMASVALSAVTLPLIGGGALALPGKSASGGMFKLKLIACKECTQKEGNWLGLFMMNKERASRHPHWKNLQEAGFTSFIEGEKIPYELKMDLDS